jgi:hypothetical protein
MRFMALWEDHGPQLWPPTPEGALAQAHRWLEHRPQLPEHYISLSAVPECCPNSKCFVDFGKTPAVSD